MKKFNLNDTVLVKLTDLGQDIFYHQHDRLNERGVKIIPHFPKVDENGFTSFQLWVFMELYGPHIGMCKPLVIEELYIYVEDDALEEVDDETTEKADP